jgi:hypothetical protein
MNRPVPEGHMTSPPHNVSMPSTASATNPPTRSNYILAANFRKRIRDSFFSEQRHEFSCNGVAERKWTRPDSTQRRPFVGCKLQLECGGIKREPSWNFWRSVHQCGFCECSHELRRRISSGRTDVLLCGDSCRYEWDGERVLDRCRLSFRLPKTSTLCLGRDHLSHASRNSCGVTRRAQRCAVCAEHAGPGFQSLALGLSGSRRRNTPSQPLVKVAASCRKSK